MSKKAFMKKFQKDCEEVTEYQEGGSRALRIESDSATGLAGVPLNVFCPISSCGSELEGASSVSALEPEMGKAGQLDPSKGINYRDIQNNFENWTRAQGLLPLIEKSLLGPIIVSNIVAGPSIIEARSRVQGYLREWENRRLVSTTASEAVAGSFREQKTFEAPSLVQGCLSEWENSPLVSTTASNTLVGPSRLQETFEDPSRVQGYLPLWENSPLVSTTALNSVAGPSRQQNAFEELSRLQAPSGKMCTICKKEFTTPYKLKMHFRTHTGEKPFECNLCEKRFTQKVHLKRHYMRHWRETFSVW